MLHQYVERETGEIRTETLFADRIVNLLYSKARERVPTLLKALTGPRMSSVLGFVNYDLSIGSQLAGNSRFVKTLGIDLNECVEPLHKLNTPRAIFERKIRYWKKREMPGDPEVVVSPADAKVLVGSLCDQQALFIKDKFFDFEELLGRDRRHWLEKFHRGDFAVFRLTPEKYHYNHTPVAGEVVDLYELDGEYHSCNPVAIVAVATPYSKNKRVVTVIDTDVPNGTGVGLVVMIEVVALMIGEIVQAYSDERYSNPRPLQVGQFVEKGVPKSLYRPGSSTDVLIFERGRVQFDHDLVSNMYNQHASSRFSKGFDMQLVETDVQVRSSIAQAVRGI